MKKKTKEQRIKELERKVLELQAETVTAYFLANERISKASNEHLVGSGVVLQLTFIGGAEAINPVLIRDGLRPETIEALREDLKDSCEVATTFALLDKTKKDKNKE